MQSNKQNQIVDLTFSFSLKLIKYCTILNLERKYQISNQLFKSGTSTGANVREAQNAESLADFIHKIKSLQKKQMKPIIGYNYVKNQKDILIRVSYVQKLIPFKKYCFRIFYSYIIIITAVIFVIDKNTSFSVTKILNIKTRYIMMPFRFIFHNYQI